MFDHVVVKPKVVSEQISATDSRDFGDYSDLVPRHGHQPACRVRCSHVNLILRLNRGWIARQRRRAAQIFRRFASRAS